MDRHRALPLLALVLTILSTGSRPPHMLEVKPAATAPLVINEYLADPPTTGGDANGDGVISSTQDEFVELVNDGASSLNVGGFTISDAQQVRFTFPAGTEIPPGEATVVFGGGTPTGAFGNAAANGLVFTASGLSLNNTGDSIIVKDPDGVEIARVDFGSSEGSADQSITRDPDVTGAFVRHSLAAGSGGAIFSPGTRVNRRAFVTDDPLITAVQPDVLIEGTSGVSLVVTGARFQSGSTILIDGLAIVTEFVGAEILTATIPDAIAKAPGRHLVVVMNPDGLLSNEVAFTVLARVGINEFLADPPDDLSGDANGDGVRSSSQDEFVELVNRTEQPLDISGYTISDADSLRFTFPAGTLLPAGEAAVVFGGGTPAGEFGNAFFNGLVFTASLSLNNGGDSIVLRDPSGIEIERVTFGSAEGNANQSLTRVPDSIGVSFLPHSTAGAGSLFSPGARVDGSPFTPAPRLTRLDPDRVVVGEQPVEIVIVGNRFVPGATALLGSRQHPVQLISESELKMTIDRTVVSPGDVLIRVLDPLGNRSNPLTLTVIPPAPVIFSLLPSSTEMGTDQLHLIIDGAAFRPGAKLLVNDESLAATFISAARLTATIGLSITDKLGTHLVQVENPDGQRSNTAFLEVVPPRPRITALSPASVLVGSGDFELIVSGQLFENGATVLLGHEPLATRFVSDAQLRADVPATFVASTGTRDVTVNSPGNGLSDPFTLNVVPVAPIIHRIDPAAVIEGSDPVDVTITGEGFKPGALVRPFIDSRVRPPLDTEVVSAELIRARVPASMVGTPGSLMLRVENPDLGFSNMVELRVLIKDPIVINEFLADPPDGPAGDANGDGNRNAAQDEFIELVNRTSEPFDISGYRLSDADTVRHVFAQGTVIPPFEAVVVFGGGNPTGEFGNAAENGLVFRASTGGLSLGNTGDVIKLSDPDGVVIQEVRYGAVEGSADQSINRSPDRDGSEFKRHTVLSAGGRRFSPGTSPSGETYSFKPRIAMLEPSSARIGSTALTLAVIGSVFQPGAVIIFDGVDLDTSWISDSTITADVPESLLVEGGRSSVRVRNPRGEISSTSTFLISDDPPVITSLTPSRVGSGADQVELTITGDRFHRGAMLLIGDEPIEPMLENTSSLRCILPGRFFTRASILQLRVLNADGHQSNPMSITVENGPLITRLSPRRLKAGPADRTVTIGGVAFAAGVIVLINDQPVATEFRSDTGLEILIPASLISEPGELLLQALNPDGGRSNKARLRVR